MTSIIIRDDGEFYIDLNGNYTQGNEPGFLNRRCTMHDGHDCIGGFDQSVVDGTWRADVTAILDPETDTDITVLAAGVTRQEAITALWSKRHTAYFKKA